MTVFSSELAEAIDHRTEQARQEEARLNRTGNRRLLAP
jgi:hypothetical protein